MPEDKTKTILDLLAQSYPDAQCALLFRNPFELLIATMLAAQATDKSVNKVTTDLFKEFPVPQALGQISQEVMEEKIKTIGLYRNKAKNILATCRTLVEKHGGAVPNQRELLESLPGVGRKTASVVLAEGFNIPAIAVDTHVFRVANRLGLASAKDVAETEKQLMDKIPKEMWRQSHHWLIHHGRQICAARNPKCGICPLVLLCPSSSTDKQ